MLPSLSARSFAVLCVFGTLFVCSSSNAQNYGPNPGRGGFVPLVSGPIAEGTTGNLDLQSDASSTGSNGSVALSNNAGLSFQNGIVSLTLTNTGGVNAGFYNFLAAFGNVDFIYETMMGRLIRVTSLVSESSIALSFDFTGNGGYGPNNPNDTDTPDANPTTGTSNTQNGGRLDNSPGNPIAN